jgi:hypothetical protein
MMKNFFLYITIAVFAIFGGRCSCDKSNPAAVNSQSGTLDAKIMIGNVGSLGKQTAINKTAKISLMKGYVQLSFPGETSIYDTFNLSGNSLIQIDRIFHNLKAGSWKIKASSKDSNGVVIHSDSSSFLIKDNDTTYDTLVLAAKYSNLVLNFPHSDSAKVYQVSYNGIMIINDTITKGSMVGLLSLSYNYLPASPAGTSDTIVVNILGDFIQQNILLWNGQGVFNVVSGISFTQAMDLQWYGPAYGDVNSTVKFGEIATVTVTVTPSPRPNTSSTP